ncbi:hypothetical protein GGR56DRAFT_431019 [Xylariaceae sp. FL0804]|nr:hypothetical protein GGR56DRAFT_431019 [Xylariaceae sp. FL0804]
MFCVVSVPTTVSLPGSSRSAAIAPIAVSIVLGVSDKDQPNIGHNDPHAVAMREDSRSSLSPQLDILEYPVVVHSTGQFHTDKNRQESRLLLSYIALHVFTPIIIPPPECGPWPADGRSTVTLRSAEASDGAGPTPAVPMAATAASTGRRILHFTTAITQRFLGAQYAYKTIARSFLFWRCHALAYLCGRRSARCRQGVYELSLERCGPLRGCALSSLGRPGRTPDLEAW